MERDVTDLLERWRALAPNASSEVAVVRALAGEFVRVRAGYFAENARMQAEATRDDDATVHARIDANTECIKACTVALGEMNEALGLTSQRVS